MDLSESDVKEFISIVKKETGKEISIEEAYEYASRLVELYESIYRPIAGFSKLHNKWTSPRNN